MVEHEVRHIEAVLRDWDPIGLGEDRLDGGPAADEYDSYAPAIRSLLARGASVEDLTDHLHRIETQTMGMRGNIGRTLDIAQLPGRMVARPARRMRSVIAVGALCAVVFPCSCAPYHETRSKEEYAALQRFEFHGRAKAVAAFEIAEERGYRAIGFRREGGRDNVWVLLNAKYRPYYKQVPGDAAFRVSAEAVAAAARIPDINPAVLEELRRRYQINNSANHQINR